MLVGVSRSPHVSIYPPYTCANGNLKFRLVIMRHKKVFEGTVPYDSQRTFCKGFRQHVKEAALSYFCVDVRLVGWGIDMKPLPTRSPGSEEQHTRGLRSGIPGVSGAAYQGSQERRRVLLSVWQKYITTTINEDSRNTVKTADLPCQTLPTDVRNAIMPQEQAQWP
jgi:hypothetical protein